MCTAACFYQYFSAGNRSGPAPVSNPLASNPPKAPAVREGSSGQDKFLGQGSVSSNHISLSTTEPKIGPEKDNAAGVAGREKLPVEHSMPAGKTHDAQPIAGPQWQPKRRLTAVAKIALSDELLLQNLDPKNKKAAAERIKAWLKTPGNRATHFDRLLTRAINTKQEDRAHLLLSIRTEVIGSRRARNARGLDLAIDAAVQSENIRLLSSLLDVHPHAGPDPADRSPGACISSWFRQLASCFNSDAAAWQGRQAAKRLNAAARAGNTGMIQILLDRCMDLGKQASMLEPALRIAVEIGKPEATRLLLQEVLKKQPKYTNDGGDLTGLAARKKHANVLEVLVKLGMKLPAENSWQHRIPEIEVYLRWIADGRPGSVKQTLLSPLARRNWESVRNDLTPEFNSQLNGNRGNLNDAQKNCQVAGLCACSTLRMADASTYADAGFTAETAGALAAKLEEKPESHIPGKARTASAGLARAVAREFDQFTNGEVNSKELTNRLVDKGMYGVVADLVVHAAESAVKSALWLTPNFNRKPLFAAALVKSASTQENIVQEAGDASGDSTQFHHLLRPQVELLASYCRTHSTAPARKRRNTP